MHSKWPLFRRVGCVNIVNDNSKLAPTMACLTYVYQKVGRLLCQINAYILNVLSVLLMLHWLFWFQCVIRGARSSEHSGKIEAAISFKHQDVHLRTRSDRKKIGQLIKISDPSAEMILFLSWVRFLQKLPKMTIYSSLCILLQELSAYTHNSTAFF